MNLSGYRIDEKRFESGRTRVFRARRRSDGASVMIKTPRAAFPTTSTLNHYDGEHEILASLEGQGAVRTDGLMRDGHRPVLILEDFGAVSLRDFLAQGRPDLELRLRIAVRVAGCLGLVHDRRVIHRDLTPSNILVGPESHEVKLADFSAATHSAAEWQEGVRAREIQGTLPYISPEQTGRTHRPMDHRTDIYSLGATLYELFTGGPPFESDDPAGILHAHVARRPIPPAERDPEVPPCLSAIIMKCLAKDPEDRYQSARGLEADLGRAFERLQATADIPVFALGERDVPLEIRISRKLYGREAEWTRFDEAVARVRRGGTDWVLVTGEEGCGKSAFLAEAARRLQDTEAFVAAGASQPSSQHVPYAALTEAIGRLVDGLLELPEREVKAWRDRLGAALGAVGPSVAHVIPGLGEFLVQADEAPSRDAAGLTSAVQTGLRKLLSAFATRGHPVVLVLDDLHWADGSTVAFLREVLLESPVESVLVLASCREQALGDAHPLGRLRRDLEDETAMYTELALPPLTGEEVTSLLEDTLLTSGTDVRAFAEILAARTLGNPLSLHAVLADLARRGVFTHDVNKRGYVWDQEAVRGIESVESAAALMINRLIALPPERLTLLQQAACIGVRFDLPLLSVISEIPEEALRMRVDESVAEGFLLRVRSAGGSSGAVSSMHDGPRALAYRFAHPRIQEALAERMPETDRARVHLQIVRALRREDAATEHEVEVFEIADHYEHAAERLSSPEERSEAAEIELAAGQKALHAGAADEASRYLRAGIRWLPAGAWEHHYELTFRLHERLAWTASNMGREGAAEALQHAKTLLAHARSVEDQLRAYGPQLKVHMIEEDFKRVVALGRKALRVAGLDIPARITKRATLQLDREVQALMGERGWDDLRDLPPMQDPTLSHAVDILLRMPGAFGHQRYWYAYFGLTAAKLCLEHGFNERLAVALAMAGKLFDVSNANELRRLREVFDAAQVFAEQNATRMTQGDISGNIAGGDGCFVYPYGTVVEMLRTSVEIGDAEGGSSAITALWYQIWAAARFAGGASIGEVIGQVTDLRRRRGTRQTPYVDGTLALLVDGLSELQAVEDNPVDDSDSDNGAAEASPTPSEPGQDLVVLYFAALRAFLLTGPEAALPYTDESLAIFSRHEDYWLKLLIPELLLLYGLALAATAPVAPGREPRELADAPGRRRHFRRILRLFETWAQVCPDNYAPKYLLLRAEQQRILGKRQETTDLYDQAAAAAGEYGLIQYEAIINERAAAFHFADGREKAARGYLMEARYLYERWGAGAKVRHLESAYPDLLAVSVGAGSGSGSSTSSSDSSSTGNDLLDRVELSTVLRSSQAIMWEMKLDKLLLTMLSLAMENAGARRGLWILERDGRWVVDAECEFETGSRRAMQSIPIEEAEDLSLAIVQYVIRSNEPVVLHDAAREGRFTRDPYVRKNGSKSLLSSPVRLEGKVTSVLWLENELSTHVFTPERVEVLRLLAGQAAISLANAQTHEHLDRLVKERTAELEATLETLRRTQAQMLESEKMASLGRLTAGVAHEINNPVNFVVSSTAPLKRDLEDVLDVLKAYEQAVEKLGLEQKFEQVARLKRELDWETVTAEIEDLIRGIEEGARRTAEIIKGLRNFSRLDEEEIKQAKVTEGIDSTLMLLRKRYEPRIRIIREYAEIPEIDCYPGKLNQVYMNLLTNAIQAIPGEGEIHIAVENTGGSVRIRIQDSGPGIPPEVRNRMFEPFFTTKEVGEGTGLGLSICYGIIEKHKGTIDVETEPGRGTAFIITLPVRQAQEV